MIIDIQINSPQIFESIVAKSKLKINNDTSHDNFFK